MRCRILIYLIIITGFITSCTRDSTELNIYEDTDIEKIISEGEEVEVKLGFNAIGCLLIEEKPLGAELKTNTIKKSQIGFQLIESSMNNEVSAAGAVSIINNPEFNDAVIGIQITDKTNGEIVAGGLFEFSNKTILQEISLPLIHGRIYKVEATLIQFKNDRRRKDGSYTHPFIDKNCGSYYIAMDNSKDWVDPEKMYKFRDLSRPYQRDVAIEKSKMFYYKNDFTVGINNATIPINLRIMSFQLKFDMNVLPDDWAHFLINANSEFPFYNSVSECEQAIILNDWFPIKNIKEQYDKNIAEPYSIYDSFNIQVDFNNKPQVKKTDVTQRKIYAGKSYTIKADFPPPQPVVFKLHDAANDAEDNFTNGFFTYDAGKFFYYFNDIKPYLQNPDDFTSSKYLVSIVCDIFNMGNDIKETYMGKKYSQYSFGAYTTRVSGAGLMIFIMDAKKFPPEDISLNYEFIKNNCDDAIGAQYSTFSNNSGQLKFCYDFDEETRTW